MASWSKNIYKQCFDGSVLNVFKEMLIWQLCLVERISFDKMLSSAAFQFWQNGFQFRDNELWFLETVIR